MLNGVNGDDGFRGRIAMRRSGGFRLRLGFEDLAILRISILSIPVWVLLDQLRWPCWGGGGEI